MSKDGVEKLTKLIGELKFNESAYIGFLTDQDSDEYEINKISSLNSKQLRVLGKRAEIHDLMINDDGTMFISLRYPR